MLSDALTEKCNLNNPSLITIKVPNNDLSTTYIAFYIALYLKIFSRVKKFVQSFFFDLSFAVVNELQDGLQLLGVGVTQHDHGVWGGVVNKHLLEVGAGDRLGEYK